MTRDRSRFGLHARRSGTSRGQGLAEFALVLPLFILLFFGVVDGGRAIFAYNQMSQSVRTVARVASTTCFQTTTRCDTTSGPIAASIASQATGLQGPVTWTIQCIDPANGGVAAQCQVGFRVRVSVTSTFNLITPAVAQVFGPVHVGSTTEQEIIQ
jgi:Flp pilus assembly protein TadG